MPARGAGLKVAIINQARMTSTRLPGKVLLEVLGKPLLEYQIERLKRVGSADMIITATTDNVTDDPIVALSEKLGVPLFRGPEHDVLGRFYGAAKAFGVDVIVRVTSDCPINDPAVIDQVIRYYLERQDNLDFVNTGLKPTFPNGIGAGVFPFRCLEEAYLNAIDPAEREHVTPYIYWRPEKFRLGCVANEKDCSGYRWTLDTQDDFELIRRIIEALYPVNPAFGWKDVLALLGHHPEWMQINAHVRQKLLNRSASPVA